MEWFFDMISYLIGYNSGKGKVVLSGDSNTYTDDGEGNITIAEVE